MRTLAYSLLFVFAVIAEPQTTRAEGDWSGCNQWGCWQGGGGCNQWGCWNSTVGTCNQWGCSNGGTCNQWGCPPSPSYRTRRGPPGPPQIVVQPVPVPVPQTVPQQVPQQPRPQAPVDYARESTSEPTQVFDQAGIRFEYPRSLTVTSKAGSIGAYAELRGPRSFSAYILRKQTPKLPAAVRDETVDGMVQDLTSAGLRLVGRSRIGADFSGVTRQGLRVRLDNRDDVYLMDAYAWQPTAGEARVVIFSYKSADSQLAQRYIPIIADTLQ